MQQKISRLHREARSSVYLPWKYIYCGQGHNHGENLVATSTMVGRICPHGGDRVKVSENLGLTMVVPLTPVETSLVVVSNNGWSTYTVNAITWKAQMSNSSLVPEHLLHH
jgi:hypothetical protein